MSSLWFEKYRPKTLDSMILSDLKKEAIRKWFADFQAGQNAQCALLFTGPPGLGKTTLAHAVLKEFGYKPKEFNASDIRSQSLINENLDGLINVSDVARITNRAVPETGIIMDEVDGMFKGDRGGIDELLSFIAVPSTRKKTQSKNENRRIPVICICNVGNVKKDTIKQLQKECHEISFFMPTTEELGQALDNVAQAEGLQVDADARKSVIQYAQGDFRRLVNILEFMALIYGRHITQDTLHEAYNSLCKKERDMHVTDSVQRLLNEPMQGHEIHTIYDADKSKTPMVVHQNYISAIAAQQSGSFDKLMCALRCIDSLCISDKVEKAMYNSQAWHLQPIQGFTCAQIPNYYINAFPKKGVVKATWASVLSVSSQSQNRRKDMYEILYNIARPLSYSIDDVQHIIETIFVYVINNELEMAISMMQTYGLCESDEFKKKKAVLVLNKMSKFIKISPVFGKWVKFRDSNKTNKTLDARIRATISSRPGEMRVSVGRIKPSTVMFSARSKPTIKAKTVTEQLELIKSRECRVVVKKKPSIVPKIKTTS